MAKLPDLTQLGLEAPQPQAGAVGYRATSGLEEAPSQAATDFGQKVQQIAFQQQDVLDTTRAEDAWNNYKSQALDLSVGKQGFTTQLGGNAVNGSLYQNYTGQLGNVRKQIEAGLTDDNVRRRFAERANVTDLQFKDALLRHYTEQRNAYEKQTFDGTMATAASMVAADPMNQQTFDTALLNATRRSDALAQHQGITDQDAIDKMRAAVKDQLIAKRIDGLVYSDPINADKLFRLTQDQVTNPELRLQLQAKTREASLSVGATIEAQKLVDQTRASYDMKTRAPRAVPVSTVPGADAAIESLMAREGGYTPKDGNSGAPANFGINQRANPDIDVSKLTKDQAKQVYKTRYWDAIGGDRLPPATAMVALDAAALQGVAVAKKLIMDADGDPQAMIDIRRNQLTNLAASDPTQRPFLPQWMKRLDGLEKQVTGMQQTAYHPDDPMAQNTSGLPNSRDLAAQLPIMEGQVDKRTNELYGNDPTNPDWQAFNKRMKAEVRFKVAQDVEQLKSIQRQAQGQIIDAILGPTGGGTAQPQASGTMTVGTNLPAGGMQVTSFSQIQADPNLMRSWQLLDPGNKPALLNLMNRQLDKNNGDVNLYRSLFNRIHLEPGDPAKIDFYKQIVDPSVADRLSMQQIQSLRMEIDRNETPGGRSLNQMRKAADTNVALFFKTTPMFTAQPDRQIAATMKWNEDVGKKIDDYVKAGQADKVRALFQTDSPESVVNAKYLQTYVNSTPAQGLSQQAAAARAGQAPIAPVKQPDGIDTREKLDAWFQTLPATATTFVGTDGKVRAIPPRAGVAPATQLPAASSQGAPAQSAWAPNANDVRADGSQKGTGFLGPLVRPDGKTSTEISISTDAVGGKDFPLLVPTLNQDEVNKILAIPTDDPQFFDKVPKTAIAKATAFAEERAKAGKPLFAQPGEQTTTTTGAAPTAAAEPQPAPDDVMPVRLPPEKELPARRAEAYTAMRTDTAKATANARKKLAAIFPDKETVTSILKSAAFSIATRGAGPFANLLLEGAGLRGEQLAQALPVKRDIVNNLFRNLISSGYRDSDGPLIKEALLYGDLTPVETKKAKYMLTQIEGK